MRAAYRAQLKISDTRLNGIVGQGIVKDLEGQEICAPRFAESLSKIHTKIAARLT